MARFALLLPREEMVEPAGRIARELEMDVVLNQSVPTERILDLMEDCRRTGADILVARGRQASILKEHTDFPVVEIQLTGLEIARLLHRARGLVSHLERPKIGVVTIPNMVGNIQGFEEIFDIELHTYFISGLSEMERGAEQAVADGMDVILGGDFVNAYCRRLGKRTLFFDGTEDSLRTSLLHARNVGQVADAERRNTAHLQVLLDYSFNGILELDARGIIVQSNDVACKILEQEREKLVGLPLSTLMPREDAEFWADALAQRRELYFSVLNVAGVHVVANAAPVADWDAGEGMVFSFYEMQKMERQGERALRERYRLQRYLAHGRFEDVNHTSREMSRLVKLARTFAETGQPILVYGEVGSGKSLFAQSIHNASPCSKGPFVTFDCAAHSPEQEAALSRAGKAADTGTLYLDNLDQLTPGGQRVLCRLLREGVVHVQGENTPTPEAARVIGSLTGDLAPKLEACDGLVVGSPVYYASANATLVALLTRLFYSTPFDKTMKVGASVVAARRGGLSSTFDELNKFFTISGMPVASSQYWNSIHGRLPGEAAQDAEGLQTMRTLARNMAFLVKSIALGREKYGLPEREEPLRTHFIR